MCSHLNEGSQLERGREPSSVWEKRPPFCPPIVHIVHTSLFKNAGFSEEKKKKNGPPAPSPTFCYVVPRLDYTVEQIECSACVPFGGQIISGAFLVVCCPAAKYS